ncbi:MAG: hypothetical protein E2O96_04470 [Acidobacteria bacterium]|nr:MAG: hypothetical protein E2O96_04470 [Acidobacteriota bacterium]
MNDEPSGWAIGWTAFAGFMMVLLGFWWIIAGLVAVINDSFFVVTQEWVFEFSTTTWGWIHLVLGVIILFSGFGLFSGNVMARTVGVLIGVVSGFAAFAWLPYYPVWAILFIAVSVAIIWSLTAHGLDITEA